MRSNFVADVLSPASCVSFNLRKAARLIGQIFDQHLQPTGLKNTQFSLLRMVQALAPVSITELADKLVMDRTTLTRNLKPVEREGLIEVTAGADARSRNVRLTNKGRKRVQQALPYWESAQVEVTQALGDAHWRVLRKELDAVIKTFHSVG